MLNMQIQNNTAFAQPVLVIYKVGWAEKTYLLCRVQNAPESAFSNVYIDILCSLLPFDFYFLQIQIVT